MAPSKQRIQMNPTFLDLKSATERNKKALKCVISALQKYDTACIKASESLTSDIAKCLKQLDQLPVRPVKK